MTTLEQVMNLKSQGMQEQEIINNLQESGISPKEITSALSQVQVKNAAEGQHNFQGNEMHASMMPMENESEKFPAPKPDSNQNFYTPQTESYPQSPAQNFQMPYSPQEFQSESYQPEQYESGNYGTDTMIDIAEQVFAEKMSLISKQLDNLKELKTITESRLNHIEERLRKIEFISDSLQIEILKKIGSYGENLQSIKDEMSMMQNSFGKVINPLVDKNSSIDFSTKAKKR